VRLHWVVVVALSGCYYGENFSRFKIGDAAPMDGAQADGAAPGGGFVCPSGAILCEDFEATTGWTTESLGYAVVVVDAVRPFHGEKSLHASPRKGPDPMMNLGTDLVHALPAVMTGTLAARLYVYATSLTADYTIYFSLGGANDQINVLYAENYMVTPTAPHSYLQGATSVGEFWPSSPSQVTPIGQWTCIELVVDLTGAGHATLYADGLPVADSGTAAVYRDPAAGFDRVNVGVVRNPATADDELFVDDLVIHSQRVGCE
jgi:hypothetical protein